MFRFHEDRVNKLTCSSGLSFGILFETVYRLLLTFADGQRLEWKLGSKDEVGLCNPVS